jgi:hypothetical protein
MMGLYSCGGMPGNSSGSGLPLGWQVCLTVPVAAPKHYKGVGGEGKKSAPPGAPFRRVSFSNIIGWGPSGLGKIAQH